MPFAAIASFIRPEYPQYTEDESSVGNVWQYRGPSATIVANIPAVGDAWADGRKVSSVQHTPSLDNSGYDDLIVSTVFNYVDGQTLSTTLTSERYQIRWMPQDLPLQQHPGFVPGGVSDLSDTTGSGSTGTNPLRTGYAEIIGWEEEQDAVLKGSRKYERLISGQPTGDVITVTVPGAIAYVKLRQLGYESYTVFLPVWTKVSTYTGTEVPGTGSCGQYVAAASVPGSLDAAIKADFPDWIKTGDSAERIGRTAKWTRTEEWTGYPKVYYDTDTLNPASHTLP